ncbi:MAG: TolC family protein, partial [Acidobacteria bacterium]|nr:TolC family protein [Acidobacteriota bacterium]
MSHKIIFILSILLSSATLALGQAPEPQPPPAPAAERLTLEQAIDIALQDNRPMKNARLELDNYQDRLAGLKTKRLPSFKVSSLVAQPLTGFDLTFEKGTFGTFASTGPIPNEDTTISSSMKPTALVTGQITQPLSQLYRIKLNIEQMKLSREISREDLRLKQQAVVNDVKRAYYAVLQTQSAFESAETSVKLYQEIERVTEDYVMQQAALKTEQLQVQEQLARAEYQLLTLQNQLASQKEQLNNLLGRDVRTEFSVTDGVEVAQVVMRETDLSAARERALAQRPEINAARLRIGQAKYDKRIKKSEYLPDVSISANYVSPFGFSSVLPTNIASVGIQVEWEVFDWGRKKREMAEKQRGIEQAGSSLRETENQVLMDVNNQFRKLQESYQLLRIARMSQET